jgi:CO/xanthine dehydrogenase FAD-binding subunit
MRDFGYVAPDSLAEALAHIAGCDGRARLLAGGTNLIPQLRWREGKPGCKDPREMTPDILVSLRKLKELDGLVDEGDHWRVGAMTRLRSLAGDEVKAVAPLLAQVAATMASPEIRNVATLGGNLCNGSPAASLLGPLLALGGQVSLASASGERVLDVGEFNRGPHRTALRSDEVVTALLLPKAACSAAWGHAEYSTRPTMGMALASASVVVASESSADAPRIRLALVPASGRPQVLDVDLSADLEEAQVQLTRVVEPVLRTQESKVASCHYAKENPQVPVWYLERRVLLLCREALAQAWTRLTAGEV